jgi:WD40 repeat protein
LIGHTAAVTALALPDQERRLISASADGTVRAWRLESGEQLTVIKRDCSFSACEVTPDGRTVVAGDTTGNMHVLSL